MIRELRVTFAFDRKQYGKSVMLDGLHGESFIATWIEENFDNCDIIYYTISIIYLIIIDNFKNISSAVIKNGNIILKLNVI